MDYDLTDIPAGYDRSRDHGPEFLNLWMHALEPHLNDLDLKRILDLGCGTGRFSEALSVHLKPRSLASIRQ
jgi:2-polyprenyl-3-methyl-5-hydroxy-6-metoxy-1,4-benzoquinol methylase